MLIRSRPFLSKRYARGPTPNMDLIRDTVHAKFTPVHFMLKGDFDVGPYLYDQHFIGILCSPKFEGKKPSEMYEMFNHEMNEIGMAGRVRITLQPPSRWNMLWRQSRWRYGIDC